jgi:hypothetical protein
MEAKHQISGDAGEAERTIWSRVGEDWPDKMSQKSCLGHAPSGDIWLGTASDPPLVVNSIATTS